MARREERRSTSIARSASVAQRTPPVLRMHPFSIGLVGALGVLVAVTIGAMVGQLATVLVYVGVALFLSLGLDPIVSFLERRMPRGLAIGAVVLIVLAAFAGIILAVVPVLIEQITNLVKNLPGYVENVQAAQWYKDLDANYGSNVQDALNGALKFVQDPENIFSLGGGILSVGSGIASGVTGIIIVLILTLYFLASLRSIKRTATRFVPAYRRERFRELLDDVAGAVGRYVMGQASLAAINGILTLILMSIIGAPLPALLAVFAFVGSLIPLVGTLTASILNTLICLFASPITAAIAGGWYLVYMQIEAYVISPRIMNRAVSVPGAVVVIGAVAGGALGGILGALVAIPIAASILIILQKVVFPSQDAKIAPPELVTQE